VMSSLLARGCCACAAASRFAGVHGWRDVGEVVVG
jgi:hypothetical protein